MILLSVDYGMGMTKFIYEYKKKLVEDCFESRLKKGEGDITMPTLINGEKVTFGEGNLAVEYGHLGKADEIHRLLMYKAMYQCYSKTGETKFRIAVVCSLSAWIDDKGESTRNEMFSKKKVNWNNEVEFEIEEILVFPETLTGALTTDLSLKDEDVICVDIGTRNLQLLRIINGRPDVDNSKSPEIGMDSIYGKISNVVKMKHSQFKDLHAVKRYLQVTSIEAEENEKIARDNKEEIELAKKENREPVLVDYKNKYKNESLDEGIKQVLLDSIFSVIEKPINDMGKNDFTKMLFLGGGSAYLKRFLHNFFKEDEMNFVANSFYANVRGLHKKAKQVFDMKDKQAKLLQGNIGGAR